MTLRQIRAIPHNAILQQLGYPLNVLAGVGTAADENLEPLAQLLNDSARGRQILRLLRAANSIASIKTVAAYGELFNSAYWATRTYRGAEQCIATPCLRLADIFAKDDRADVFRRLASRLRIDSLKLHRLLALCPDEQGTSGRSGARLNLGVLHALRLALMQFMFIRVVSIPAFSRANDVARDDVLEMVFSLRVEEALDHLRRAFPMAELRIDDFALDEPTAYPDSKSSGYTKVHTAYIDPIEKAWFLCRRISLSIANEFRAHG
jgi:phosphoenolpyruvate carboxylase